MKTLPQIKRKLMNLRMRQETFSRLKEESRLSGLTMTEIIERALMKKFAALDRSDKKKFANA